MSTAIGPSTSPEFGPGRDAVPGTGLTVAVLAVSSLTVMSNATISPSLPGLAAAFADTPGIAILSGLVLSLPSLSILLTAALFGRAADRVNRRGLMAILLLCYGAAGASGALAESMEAILVGRVLLGIAVAGTMTLATTLAGDHWQGAAQQRFMGQQAAAMAAGGILFLLFGGALAELSWRGPFLIYLSSWLLIPLVLLSVPPHGPVRAPETSSGPASAFPWGFFAGIGALATFGMTMFYLVPTRLPFLLAEIGVPAPSAAGFTIAAMTLASMVTSLGFGRIRRYLGPQSVFAVAFVLMAAGYLVVGLSGGFVPVVIGTMIAGLGLGLTFPNQMSWLMARVPADARGRAAGMLTSAVFAGQLLSPLLSGALKTVLATSTVYLVFAAILTGAAVAMARPWRMLR
ncbi:MAG: MFS transporter [Pseudomonadota bacterium]